MVHPSQGSPGALLQLADKFIEKAIKKVTETAYRCLNSLAWRYGTIRDPSGECEARIR